MRTVKTVIYRNKKRGHQTSKIKIAKSTQSQCVAVATGNYFSVVHFITQRTRCMACRANVRPLKIHQDHQEMMIPVPRGKILIKLNSEKEFRFLPIGGEPLLLKKLGFPGVTFKFQQAFKKWDRMLYSNKRVIPCKSLTVY